MATGKFWANNHTHVVQGKWPVSTDFLYLFMANFDVSGYITGAAQPKITQANLNRILLIVPPKQLLEQFSELVGNLLSCVRKLEEKNTNLRRTRDLLLPKLISGEIDVEELEIETGEEMHSVVESLEPVKIEEVAPVGEQGTLWG